MTFMNTTTNTATAQHLTIVGPLGDGSFHIHGTGCVDLLKAKYHGYTRDGAWAGVYTSQQDVVCDIYADFIEDDSEWASYAEDVRFFPCSKVR